MLTFKISQEIEPIIWFQNMYTPFRWQYAPVASANCQKSQRKQKKIDVALVLLDCAWGREKIFKDVLFLHLWKNIEQIVSI